MILNSRNIAQLGEIATLLEVSAYPKPGNVHRTQDFNDMIYEDFLISGTVLRESLEIVAYNASKYYPNLLDKIQIGDAILQSIRTTKKLVNTNTNLGISMLLIPISAGCGALEHEESIYNLPKMVDIIMKNTRSEDAVALTKAIILAQPGGLDNKTTKYDVNNKNTIDDIINNNINLYDLFKLSSKYDKISYELINGLPIISEIGYPTYCKYEQQYSKNDVTLETYLTLLSKVPDTLINRKYGEEVAKDVTQRAKEILENTEIATPERFEEITTFDKYLRENKYNPGTTADFTAASLFVGLVDKYSKTGLY
ncbi:triphosphoribosyl-dephospho-CoA synthase [Methanosphaera sp. ISO3-F5]|uniref:triphosphoribosyl-dephospho-CoA synthase n=1 Tax=Methanosphaera sp. ISO3-F5 TaxID=1452353 RepID=UPI002B262062|nr:triphosphoribosyl-dephospho-CoA synthase [Methanosphaera sp. ISO3-F5]WQH63250.1 triphosphoribosyl-dephospho-CoA synthase [Methanosphaera sp. ISO3-F5]